MDRMQSDSYIEKIGNVALDLTFYPGEDYYCDGDVENELLDIVTNHGREEYDRIIEEEKRWEILYHLSKLRANIIDWIPIPSDAKCLEIGSGCGAITGALAEKCRELTCIELSKKRSMINANRHREQDNITIKVGNFKDIEPSLAADYDYIFLIGVFEYAKGYIGGDNPYTEFLEIIQKHLAPDGKIVIAIENKYGLKYFAGCREDHLGDYFSGIEDYPEDNSTVRTFGRNGLEKICKECGVSRYSFYYPYPDYKFMTTLYSDERLPERGELTNNLRNMDRPRLLLFDEKNAFDGMIREDMFPAFSNSYLLLIGKEEKVVYSKFSNDRAKEYAIRTDIVKGPEGELHVEKHALSRASEAHLKQILHAKDSLKGRYEGSGLVICPCEECQEESAEADGTYLRFPYLKGQTLEAKLDECLERQDMETFYSLLKRYVEFVRYRAEIQVTDYDFIFSNILIDRDTWQLIDYEWTFDRFTPPDQIACRALLCYCMGNGKRKGLHPEAVAEKLGLESAGLQIQREEELEFQMKVTGERLSISQLRDVIHHEVLPLRDAVEIYRNRKAAEQAQLYWDCGDGFHEEDSEWMTPVKEEDGALQVAVALKPRAVKLRFDPARYACMVAFDSICCYPETSKEAAADSNGSDGVSLWLYPWKRLAHNGIEIAPQVYLFKDEDPNFTLDCKNLKGVSKISLNYHITKLDPETAERFAGKWKYKG